MANRKILCGWSPRSTTASSRSACSSKLEEGTRRCCSSCRTTASSSTAPSTAAPRRETDYWEGMRVPGRGRGYLAKALQRNGHAVRRADAAHQHPRRSSRSRATRAAGEDKRRRRRSPTTWVTHDTVAPRDEMLINLNSDLFALGAAGVTSSSSTPSRSSRHRQGAKALAAEGHRHDGRSYEHHEESPQHHRQDEGLPVQRDKNPSSAPTRVRRRRECHSLYLLDDCRDAREAGEEVGQYQQEMVPSNFKGGRRRSPTLRSSTASGPRGATATTRRRRTITASAG